MAIELTGMVLEDETGLDNPFGSGVISESAGDDPYAIAREAEYNDFFAQLLSRFRAQEEANKTVGTSAQKKKPKPDEDDDDDDVKGYGSYAESKAKAQCRVCNSNDVERVGDTCDSCDDAYGITEDEEET